MSNTPSIDDLKSTADLISFIHQTISQRIQYYPEEFNIANKSILLLKEMHSKIVTQIEESSAKEGSNE